MKSKTFILIFLLATFSFKANCQTENLFMKSLGGLNGLAESAQKLWTSFFSIDSTINKSKIKDMSIDLHNDITLVINAKRSIINKIKNQPTQNINLKTEVEILENSVKGLQSTLVKYQPLIKAVGMDAQKLASNLRMEFSAKLDNLDNLENLLPNNYQRREFFITYLESGVNILNGALLLLERLK